MNLADLPALNDEDRARADHYAMIARLFRAPPDAALLAMIRRIAADFATSTGPLAEAWAALAQAAQRDAEAIGEEYDRLFIGVGRPQVFLYGSYYQAGFLMEEPLAVLRDDLAALGLARRAGVGESEDHVAGLAEAMRHLIAGGAPIARQRDFYRRHLEPWVGRLADALEAAPGADFYAPAGRLCRAFCAIESAAFDMP